MSLAESIDVARHRLAPVNLPYVLNADAARLPLRAGSVSLFVTSPPYWALRVYEDGGEFYAGQIGSEPDPVLFLRNLWRAMDAQWDALRDDGVSWVNLGDKYAGSGGHNNAALDGRRPQTEARARTQKGQRDVPDAGYERDGFRSRKAADARDTSRAELNVPTATRASRRRESIGRGKPDKRDTARTATRRNAPDRYEQGTDWARAKSLMALPWAFVLGLLNPTLYRDHLDPRAEVEEVCDTCDGHGRVAAPEGIEAGAGAGSPGVPCPDCDGEGVILVEVPHPQWIYRAEQIWDKPNGLPESVDDRPRRSHEVWLMLTKNGDHYAALDDLREPYDPNAHAAGPDGAMFRPVPMAPTWGLNGSQSIPTGAAGRTAPHPLGKLPGSVWRISSEPFVDVLYHVDTDGGRVVLASDLWHQVRQQVQGGDLSPVNVRMAEHFAPFPSEWPRRLVLGWSPQAICDVCDEGRFPVVERRLNVDHVQGNTRPARIDAQSGNRPTGAVGYHATTRVIGSDEVTILGYACACTPSTYHGPAGPGYTDGSDPSRSGRRPTPDGAQNLHKARPPRREYHLDGWDPPPSHPSVVVDDFGGTGTTAMVAAALGRIGISVDLSWDYCRLAEWRANSPKQRARARARTLAARQGTLPV